MKFSVIITALVSAASVAAGVCAPCSDACAKSVKDDNPEIEYLHKCDCDNYNGVTPLRRSETRSLHEIPEYASACVNDVSYQSACACIQSFLP